MERLRKLSVPASDEEDEGKRPEGNGCLELLRRKERSASFLDI